MLKHPTLDRLRELGLDGMAKAFEELAANPESRALEHAEWLGLLVEREATLRQQKRFEARARTAKLRHAATVEDVDFRTPRGLDRTLFLRLASGDWIREHRHCLITGKTGTGKSWLACALGDGNPTLADAILDRVVHNAHRIDLKGESRRKPAAA